MVYSHSRNESSYRLLCSTEPVPGKEGWIDDEDVIADFLVLPGLHQLHALPHHLAAHLWILYQDPAPVRATQPALVTPRMTYTLAYQEMVFEVVPAAADTEGQSSFCDV